MIPPVVDQAWVTSRSGRVLLADVRWSPAGPQDRDPYLGGHLPGAVRVDLESDLSGPGTPQGGRHPLPPPEQFAAAMSRLGIGDDTVVVGYDDAGGVFAARLVWMLRAIGHDAALLDGGLRAYDGPIETGAQPTHPATFTPRPWPVPRLATMDEVARGVPVLIDARPVERFRGDGEDPFDPRAGHIPGARSLPCRENLDASGRFLPLPELRQRFAAAGVTGDTDVVSYCGSGVTACHNLLAMEWAGLGQGRLFPGSWSAYSRTELPAATGPVPG